MRAVDEDYRAKEITTGSLRTNRPALEFEEESPTALKLRSERFYGRLRKDITARPTANSFVTRAIDF
ncbi:MAG TPA: hypothetical protein VJQ54_22760, partial [Candidatus Sulfotelmatobacter sp.]|nr:hypothetical protein [Candidatus Sulfotelmatobacter sp.]